MKKIRSNLTYFPLTLLCLFLTGAGAAQAQSKPGAQIAISSEQVSLQNDSLRIGFTVNASGLHIKALQSISIQPSLQSNDHAKQLPPVSYTGSRRLRFDERHATLHPEAAATGKPYKVYKNVSSNKTYTTGYQITIPYEPWMSDATLSVTQWFHNCCSESAQGSDILFASLGVQPAPKAEPEPEVWTPDLSLLPRMVSFITPQVEAVKNRSETVSAFLNFKRGSYVIYPDFSHNRAELDKVDELVRSVTDNELIELKALNITGYASPEGTYISNEKLSRNRSFAFRSYMKTTYGTAESIMDTKWVAEDWDSLIRLLIQSEKSYKDQVLSIISATKIFDGREKKIMDLQAGIPYNDMLEAYFPQLRRIELRADYVVSKITDTKAKELVSTRPGLLSLDELYRAAADLKPGTPEYCAAYQAAASQHPTDVVANNNAAAAMLCGEVIAPSSEDIAAARRYIDLTPTGDPRTYLNRAAVCYAEGNHDHALHWLRLAQAAGILTAESNITLIK